MYRPFADTVAAAVAIGTAVGVIGGAAAPSGTTPRDAAENVVVFRAFGGAVGAVVGVLLDVGAMLGARSSMSRAMNRLQHAGVLLVAAACASLLFGFGLAAAAAPEWVYFATEALCIVVLVGRLVAAEGWERVPPRRGSRWTSTAR